MERAPMPMSAFHFWLAWCHETPQKREAPYPLAWSIAVGPLHACALPDCLRPVAAPRCDRVKAASSAALAASVSMSFSVSALRVLTVRPACTHGEPGEDHATIYEVRRVLLYCA